MSLKIVPTPEFSKLVKKLAKDYRKIYLDLETLKEELEKNPRVGVDLGSNCYKVRLANSSIPTGKSGGFRIITYYIDAKGIIRLLFIFSKKEQANISDKELQEIIKRAINV
ncbi:MAG: type II toxin-antitoxin system RelE/ParE family toxin [Campylobacterota bacterium]|nr:type II toxin-antitoxin system RelE/ParE family toxin [Campylobacterota bacterium]